MMGPDTIWIFIPMAGMLLGAFGMWNQHRQKIAEIQMRGSNEDATDRAAHTAELEDRLRVLERIVTDKGYDVAAQIEALRDEPRMPGQLEKEAR